MPNYVLVDKSMNNKKIRTELSADYGDNVHVVDVVPLEFRSLMGFYPILLTKDSNSGEFLFASIFGFQPGENLFLNEKGWDAMYVPLNIRRRPFAILPQQVKNNDGELVRIPAMSIDLDSPRLNETSGEEIFDADGKPTPYFETAKQIMGTLFDGAKLAASLLERLKDLELIEPLQIGFEFVNGDKRGLNGLFTISDERFRALSDEVVLELHKQGHLSSIYAMLASMSQLGALVNRRNQQLSAAS